MRRIVWSIVASLSLATVACGSDSSGGKVPSDTTGSDSASDTATSTSTSTSTSTTDATTSNDTGTTTGATDTATTDTATTDTATTDTGPVTCKNVTLAGGTLAYEEEFSDVENDVAAFSLGTGENDLGFGGALGDQLWIEFYTDLTATGEFELDTADENDNYISCAQCVTVYVDIAADASGYAYDLFQMSGTLKIDDSTKPVDLAPTITLTNLKLQQVTIDADDATSTPVAGGACFNVTNAVTLTTAN